MLQLEASWRTQHETLGPLLPGPSDLLVDKPDDPSGFSDFKVETSVTFVQKLKIFPTIFSLSHFTSKCLVSSQEIKIKHHLKSYLFHNTPLADFSSFGENVLETNTNCVILFLLMCLILDAKRFTD